MVKYKLDQNNGNTIGYAEGIDYARSKAFSYLMNKKRWDIYIVNTKTGELAGVVYYESKKKDRYGDVLGPMYWSEKKNKDYLLDFDGSLFDVKTNKRIPGSITGKKKRRSK